MTVIVETLYGLGGAATSDGIVQLDNELKSIPGVTVRPWDETNWNAAVINAKSRPTEKIVLIGYSMGANNVTYVAQNLPHVDLLIGIQPTLWAPAADIGQNVDKVLLFNNDGPVGIAETQGLGARDYTFVPGFKGEFKHTVIREIHPLADNDVNTHKTIIAEVKKLV